jgi:hypothetical protein
MLHRPGGALIEAPASTTTFGPVNLPIGGGGYFRILPYAWTRWGIARVNRVEQCAAIFYLHPWEIDPGQPRLRTGLLSRFRHYHNLEQTESRLRRLLSEFHFGPLGALVAQVGDAIPEARPAWALPYLW